MKKITWTAFVLLMVFLNGILVAKATLGGSNGARYERTRFGSVEAPTTVIIRCAAWTEDSINSLDLKVFERGDNGQLLAVYRCITP